MCEYCKLTNAEKIRLNVEIIKIERKFRPPKGADLMDMLKRVEKADAEANLLFDTFNIKDKQTRNQIIIDAAMLSRTYSEKSIADFEEGFAKAQAILEKPDFKSAGMDF